MTSEGGFVPLRTDPPPELAPTLWLRSAIAVAMLLAVVSALWVEYNGRAGDILLHPVVALLHLASVGLLMLWSRAALDNAGELIPPARYSRRPSGDLAAVLWATAWLAPVVAALVIRGLASEFDGGDAFGETLAMIAVVMVALLVVWLPFRYHLLHARRLGVPSPQMVAWFWAPLLTLVGGLCVLGLGLHEELAEGGLTAADRTAQLGFAYGFGALVFCASTWRAVTVFDEVIDLRWNRWRADWEQTLTDLAAQPLPGPEGEVPRP